jgi:hypothetical protein
LQDGAYRAADAGFSWDERGRRLLEAIATVPSGSAAPEQGKGSSAVNPTVSRRGVGANPAPEAVRPT